MTLFVCFLVVFLAVFLATNLFVGNARQVVCNLGLSIAVSAVATLALCAAAVPFFMNEDLAYPYSTYIQDGTTLVEGEKVVERLPDKYQEAVARLRLSLIHI